MSRFIKIVPPPHNCKAPATKKRRPLWVGTLWQCDCGRVWEVRAASRSAVTWMEVRGRAKVSTSNVPPEPEPQAKPGWQGIP